MIAVESPGPKTELEGLFTEAFEASIASANGTPDELVDLRQQSFAQFLAEGFPDAKSETWKYTNIGKALSRPLEVVSAAATDSVSEVAVSPFRIEGLNADTLVLLDGRIVPHLSQIEPGHVSVRPLNEAAQEESVRRHFGRYVNSEDNSFVALNTAFADDGVALHVTRSDEAARPVHIVSLASGHNRFVQPRVLIVVEPDADVTIFESHHVVGSGRVFVNSVVEAFVGERGRVDYYRLQDGGRLFSAVSNTHFYQQEASHAACSTFTLSGDMIRNNVVMHPDGEHCESHLFGLFLGQGDLHVDNHTLVDHAKPNCFSNELYKGVLGDRSTGVFNGRVLVRRDAQQTNAYQSNKSIILGDGATMNAKPELEIYADDVKCSHGATTGRLDEEALFYLRSRGLTEAQASTMLLLVFVRDVLENVRPSALREHLDQMLQQRLAESGSSTD